MNKKELTILQNIQHLIQQLDCGADDEEQKPNVSSFANRMLALSKITCWRYEPMSNMLFFTDEKGSKKHPSGCSLTLFLKELNRKDRQNMLDAFHRLLTESCEEITFTFAKPFKNGQHWYEVHACCYEKCIIGTMCLLRHEDEQAQKALQDKQKFELLMSIANVFVWEYDVGKKVFSANESLCQKLGVPHKTFPIKELKKVLKIERLDDFLKNIHEKPQQDHSVIHITNPYGDMQFIFETSFNSIIDNEGKCILVLGTLHDITEQEILKDKASRDDLTGCFNRGSADVTLLNTFKRFQETKEQYMIIFFDIDKFKEYNDTFGHDAGDYVLKRFSLLIMQEIRSSDRLFRWCGDEFLLLCSGIAKENMYTYIDRLRRVIACAQFTYSGKKFRVTTSIGAAYYYANDTTYQDAMKRADRSVYKSKLAGRNNACMLLK